MKRVIGGINTYEWEGVNTGEGFLFWPNQTKQNKTNIKNAHKYISPISTQ